MKQYIIPAIRLTLICILFFCVFYPLLILGVAQLAPAKGEGVTVSSKGKIVGYKEEGQAFTKDSYFWSRPSAVGYNAAGSAGSNKGPSNPDYLKDVQSRIDSFKAHNPEIEMADIPAELVTASGSGLDPDLSPEGAKVQISRIAATRHITKHQLNELVDRYTETPFLGPKKVNVLKLNIALDEM